MRRKMFFGAMLIIVGFEGWMLQLMTGGTLPMLLPLTLLVVPALFSGLDLWHLCFNRLRQHHPWIGKSDEGSGLARFVLRWVVVSLPPTAALLGLYLILPGQFKTFASAYDAWRCGLAICIWHGFFNLPLITRGQESLSLTRVAARYRESDPR